jgi:hypothetical protein
MIRSITVNYVDHVGDVFAQHVFADHVSVYHPRWLLRKLKALRHCLFVLWMA